MNLLRIFSGTVIAVLFGSAAAVAGDANGTFSNILRDVAAYGRAISIARACGMSAEQADRAISMVMVYAYAVAEPEFSDVNRKRMFLVEVVRRVNRDQDVKAPGKGLCERSFKAIDHLPARLDAAVREKG